MAGTLSAALAALLLAATVRAAPQDPGTLTVRFVHTNDMHSRFEQTSVYSSICNARDRKENKCFGGFARIATLVREARMNGQQTGMPTFFVNAGDTYQGSRLFLHYKDEIVIKFLNMLQPDVASLGNHEFDMGVEGLVPFLDQVTFPVVTANLDLSQEPRLLATKMLHNTTVLVANGQKIGIVGYLTPDTMTLSQPGDTVKFIDEVTAVRAEARRLKASGINIVVALGHSGYETDQRIAREVDEVSLVIGGHTNTFLYTGEKKPSTEEIEGPYPTIVKKPNGGKGYVVQAYAYTKYLGDITVTFDANGAVVEAVGNPILVDGSVAQAPDFNEELDKWIKPVASKTKTLGITKVKLQGDEKVCRLYECNTGNFVTDAMIYYNAKAVTMPEGWTDAAIALHQAGGIRATIGSLGEAKVTDDEVLESFPFQTTMYKLMVTGKMLREIFEWSVHDRTSQTTTTHGGAFLHVSGIQVTYDVQNPFKSRVVSLLARCAKCAVPVFEEVEDEKEYGIIIPDFMQEGGDGYAMLKNLPYISLNMTVTDAFGQYLTLLSPVFPGVEGRISFLEDEKSNDVDSSEESTAASSSFSTLLAISSAVGSAASSQRLSRV